MGKSERTKGHNFEREVAKAFRQLYPESMRQLEYQIGLGVDVKAGPFDIQCKRNKKWCPLSKIKEVPDSPGRVPLLVTKGDREKTLVAMELDVFLKILEDIGEAYSNDW